MALFGKKKAVTAENDAALASRELSGVIVRPIVSEKAAHLGDLNVYAFEVARSATKYTVRDAVRKLFKVTPVRVNIVSRQPRQFFVRAKNRMGTHSGVKKAYVFLKKGDTINLV